MPLLWCGTSTGRTFVHWALVQVQLGLFGFILFCLPPFWVGTENLASRRTGIQCESDWNQSKYVSVAVSNLKINVPCDQQCWVRQGVVSQHCTPSALRSAEGCSEPNWLLSQSNAQVFRRLTYQSEKGSVAFQEMPGFRGRSCRSRTCLLREIVTGLKHMHQEQGAEKCTNVLFIHSKPEQTSGSSAAWNT